MFSKNQTILVFDKNKLKVVRVSFRGKNPVVQSLAEAQFTAQNLAAILVKAGLKSKKVRILLNDPVSYVLNLNIPKETPENKERQLVADQLKEKIPEILTDQDWDYKAIGQTKKEKVLLVFAPVKEFFEVLSRAINQVRLEVEAIEPAAVAGKRHHDPMVGLAMKKDLKGKDSKILNLTPLKIISSLKKERKMATAQENQEETTIPAPEASASTEEKLPVEEPIIPVEEPIINVGEPAKETGSSKKPLLIGLIVVLVLALVGGGIFVYRRAMGKKEAEPATIEESTPPGETPTEAPEATPTPELDRSELKVQVLNGRGVAGAAGKAQELLEGLGYEDVATGNADNYDYEKTEISIKEDKEAYLEMLTDDLSDDYTLAAEPNILDEDSDYDSIIIIGAE